MGHLVGQARPPYAALPSKRSQRQATALTERKEVGDDGACRSVGSQGGGRSERASERDGRQLVRCNSHPAARAARTLEVGGSGCRRRRRVVRSYDAAATTLYAAKGRRIPFNVTSPAASTLTTCSTAISTRGLIKICPGFASSLSGRHLQHFSSSRRSPLLLFRRGPVSFLFAYCFNDERGEGALHRPLPATPRVHR